MMIKFLYLVTVHGLSAVPKCYSEAIVFIVA